MTDARSEVLLSSRDAELVRWCGPYASDILRHHVVNEQKTSASAFSEADRRLVVNWICNVTRREQYKSETFWTAVSTFDRYMASCFPPSSTTFPSSSPSSTSSSTSFSASSAAETAATMQPQQRERATVKEKSLSEREVQTIAAACIQLAATYQETALSPALDELVEACDNRYTREQLRAACWRVTAALQADLYWPTPLTFYRHYSQTMRQSTLEHTMTKFVVETIAFSREALLARFLPSTLAACALFVAQWCAYDQIPSSAWIAEWRSNCFLAKEHEKAEEEKGEEKEEKEAEKEGSNFIQCLEALADWMSVALNANGRAETAGELESVLRRYSHQQLFCVARIARLPKNAGALIALILQHYR